MIPRSLHVAQLILGQLHGPCLMGHNPEPCGDRDKQGIGSDGVLLPSLAEVSAATGYRSRMIRGLA